MLAEMATGEAASFAMMVVSAFDGDSSSVVQYEIMNMLYFMSATLMYNDSLPKNDMTPSRNGWNCDVWNAGSQGGNSTRPTINLNINSQQLGQKWGKHRFDYPEMTNYNEYEQFVKNIFNNPDKIIYDSLNEEYLFIKGKDLLRIKLNGEFISLYPGVDSSIVTDAIERGGLLWEK